MKTIRTTLALVLLGAAARPALAGSDRPFDLNLWGSFIHSSTATITDPNFNIGINFADGAGFGLTANVPIVRVLSAEMGAFWYRQSAEIVQGSTRILGAGRLQSVPIVFLLQFHPNGREGVDPYLGLGAAYTVLGALHDPELDTAGIGVVSVDEKFTLAAQAGMRWALGPGFGLAIDGKYLPMKSKSQSANGSTVELQLNPFLISVGASLRF